jgi:hypothetical protein
MARLAALLLVTALMAVPVAGCGGDDDGGGGGEELDGPAAEETVKDYLRGLSGGDGEAACDTFTDDYREGIVERNQATAENLDASNCEELLEGLHKQVTEAGEWKFEGEDLTPEAVDDLDLRSEVDGESATVRGPEGKQIFELEAVDDEWKIDSIEMG